MTRQDDLKVRIAAGRAGDTYAREKVYKDAINKYFPGSEMNASVIKSRYGGWEGYWSSLCDAVYDKEASDKKQSEDYYKKNLKVFKGDKNKTILSLLKNDLRAEYRKVQFVDLGLDICEYAIIRYYGKEYHDFDNCDGLVYKYNDKYFYIIYFNTPEEFRDDELYVGEITPDIEWKDILNASRFSAKGISFNNIAQNINYESVVPSDRYIDMDDDRDMMIKSLIDNSPETIVAYYFVNNDLDDISTFDNDDDEFFDGKLRVVDSKNRLSKSVLDYVRQSEDTAMEVINPCYRFTFIIVNDLETAFRDFINKVKEKLKY